jgi:hypothetical protein
MFNRVVLITVAVVTLAMPTAARADGYIGPGLGVTFGDSSARGLSNVVLEACWLYQQPIGLEADVTYAPGFFNNQSSYGSNSVTTLMGNVVIAAREEGPPLPRGIHRGGTMRPYISGGLGSIHESTNAPDRSKTDLGADLGVGILATTSSQIGVRADLRYFRDLVGSSDGNTTSIDFGSFHFWRVSVSVLFRL